MPLQKPPSELVVADGLFANAGIDKSRPIPPDHFSTGHLHKDLKGRSVRGGIVTLGGQGVKFALNLGSTMALTRLLTPSEFGIVAMAAPVTGFIGLFKDLGLSLATVQKAEVTHDQVSTLFWANVAVSVLLTALAAAISPLVGWFYGDTRVGWVTLAVAGVFIFGGLASQHLALLSRQMRFGVLVLIDILSMMAGVVTGIVTAWYGWGYWSLVIMTLSAGIVNCIGAWTFSSWRPGMPKRGAGTRLMLKFGGGMTISNVLGYLASQVDKVMLGRFYLWGSSDGMSPLELATARAAALGVYTRAFSLFVTPILQILSPLNTVVLPLFARLAGDRKKLNNTVIRVIELAATITLPISAITFASAENIIKVVFGPNPEWEAAIPITRALAVVALTFPISAVLNLVFVGTGRSDVVAKWELAWITLLTPAVILGLPWGSLGVGWAVAIAWIIATPIHMYVGHRVTGIELRPILAIIARNAFSALIGLGGVWLAERFISLYPSIVRLVADTAIILLAHAGCMYSFGVTGRMKTVLKRDKVVA